MTLLRVGIVYVIRAGTFSKSSQLYGVEPDGHQIVGKDRRTKRAQDRGVEAAAKSASVGLESYGRRGAEVLADRCAVVEDVPAWLKSLQGRIANLMVDTRRRLPVRTALAVVICCLLSASGATATTVIAKSFQDLAVEADGIFAGVVSDVRSYRSDDGHIRTAVRFEVHRWLAAPDSKGAADDVELTFAGGRIGETAELVGGMPQFAIGQRVVIFYRDTESASPIVGFHQGCFGLRQSDGAISDDDEVVTADHLPVVGVAGGRLNAGAVEQRAITLGEFAAEVVRLRGSGSE